ncbi:MAG TPA: hypothetical protein VGJ04_11445 [Pirellulales bacterium]|jgi:hypothetical protein
MSKHETAAYSPGAPQEPAVHAAVGHEYRDVNAPWTVFSAAVVGAIVIGSCIVSRWIFGLLTEPADLRSNTSVTGVGLTLPPEPRLEGIEMMSAAQQSNATQLSVLQTEQEQLQTYGWVNKDQRTVRIPIRRAMKIVVEQGLPASVGSPAPIQPTLKAPPPNRSDRKLDGLRLSNPGNASDENR